MTVIVDAIKEFLLKIFVFPEIVTVLISVLPIVEVRGAIPIAMSYGIHPFFAWLYSFLGASAVVPILLLVFLPVVNWLKRTRVFKKIGDVLYDKFAKGATDMNGNADAVLAKEAAENGVPTDVAAAKNKRERKMMLGLFILVAIPVPGTGVWTGSAIAAICGLKFHKALLAVLAGNLVASSIVVFLCAVFADFVDWIILGIFLIAVVLALAVILKIILPKKKKPQPAEEKNNPAND